jgi:hypothetical protein
MLISEMLFVDGCKQVQVRCHTAQGAPQVQRPAGLGSWDMPTCKAGGSEQNLGIVTLCQVEPCGCLAYGVITTDVTANCVASLWLQKEDGSWVA